MTKLKIYIDFESISSPFNYGLGIKKDFPYAYSVGIFSGKQFKTKTFVFNFTKDHIDDIDDILRRQILRDVRKMKNDNTFRINATTSEFVCFGIDLERRVLRNVYNGVKVTDISRGTQLSLTKATKKYMGEIEYFPTLKELIIKNLDPKFVSKRQMLHDGAIAAYVGYLLYVYAFNKTDAKHYMQVDITETLRELVAYSKDDVVRMEHVINNEAEIHELSKKWDAVVKIKSSNGSRIVKNEKLLSFFDGLEDNMSIKDAKKLLNEQTKELREVNSKLIGPDSLDEK